MPGLEEARLLLGSDGYRFTLPLPLLDGAHSSPSFFLNLLSAGEEVMFLPLSFGAADKCKLFN